MMPEAFWQTMGRIKATNECIRDRKEGRFDRNKCPNCNPCLCQKKMLDYFRKMGWM